MTVLTGVEVAGLVLSYLQTIINITSLFHARRNEHPAIIRLFDDAHRIAEDLENQVSTMPKDLDEKAQARLQKLAVTLPGVRRALSGAETREDIVDALERLRKEQREITLLLRQSDRPLTASTLNDDKGQSLDGRNSSPQKAVRLRVMSENLGRLVAPTAIIDSGSSTNWVSRKFVNKYLAGASAIASSRTSVIQSFLGYFRKTPGGELRSTLNPEGSLRIKLFPVDVQIDGSEYLSGPLLLEFFILEDDSLSADFPDMLLGRTYLEESVRGQSIPAASTAPRLFCVHEQRETSEGDVILVHGISGDPRKTWTGSSKEFWPETFLAEDLKRFSIWTYGYNSNASMVTGSEKPVRRVLEELADQLIEAAETWTEKPIVWICHSLGGLLVKSALSRSRKQSRLSSGKPIFSRTRGVIFLGTPHSGSSLLTRSALVTSIASASLTFSERSIRDKSSREERIDSTITLTTSDFAVLMDEQSFPILSLYETRPTITENGPRKIVDAFTRLHHPLESWDRIEGNHLSICKFETREEHGYQRLKTAIMEMSERKLEQRPYDKTPPMTISSWDYNSDQEKEDVDAVYTKLRLRIDRAFARWQSLKIRNHSDGMWVRDSQPFDDWLKDGNRKPLIVAGPVGCGKSVIAESILEIVREKSIADGTGSTTCQLQVIFKSDQTAHQRPLSILQSLIAQVLDQNTAMVSHIKKQSLSSGTPIALAGAQLENTLKCMLEDNHWTSIYLVIDALDECHPEYKSFTLGMISMLSNLPNLRMALTISTGIGSSFDHERPGGNHDHKNWTAILQSYLQQKPKILLKLPDDYHWQSILREYIEDRLLRLQNLTHLPAQNLDRLKSLLTDLPYISFTVVDFIFRRLQDCESSRDKRSPKLDWFDKELDDLKERGKYYYLLEDLANRQPEPCVLVLSILSCVFETFRIEDLATIIHFDRTPAFYPVEDEMRDVSELRLNVMNKLRQLVKIDGNGLHLSSDLVRRVILERISSPPRNDRGQTNPFSKSNSFQRMHQRLCIACLRVMLAARKFQDGDPGVFIPSLSTRAYAKANWERHQREAGSPTTALSDLVLEYKRSQDPNSGTVEEPPSISYLKNMSQEVTTNAGSLFGQDEGSIQYVGADEFDDVLNAVIESEPEAVAALRQSSEVGRLEKAKLLQLLRNTDVLTKQRTLEKAIEIQSAQAVGVVLEALSELPGPMWRSDSDPLEYAVKFKSGDVIRTLLQHKEIFDLNSAFLAAVGERNLAFCEILLANGAEINSRKRPSDSTPLHLAVKQGRLDLVDLMLMWNAAIDVQDEKKRTPLHCAAEKGHTDIVDRLLKASGSLEVEDEKGRTPLFSACSYGLEKTVKLIWSKGAKLAHRDSRGRTALHEATRMGHEGVVRILLSAGLPVDVREKSGLTPLHTAALYGWQPIMERLLEAGADITAVTKNRQTVLHFACRSQNVPEDVVKLLLDLGVDPMAKDDDGCTPLLLAAAHSSVRVLKLLSSLNKSLFRDRDNDNRGVLEYVNQMAGKNDANDRKEKQEFLVRNFQGDPSLSIFRIRSV